MRVRPRLEDGEARAGDVEEFLRRALLRAVVRDEEDLDPPVEFGGKARGEVEAHALLDVAGEEELASVQAQEVVLGRARRAARLLL